VFSPLFGAARSTANEGNTLMVDRCPKCRSTDIKSTTTGRLRNTHYCNSCGSRLSPHGHQSLIPPVVAAVIGEVTVPKVLTELFDDAKKLFSGASSGGRSPQASAPIPPRQRPQPTPPVHGQPPSAPPHRVPPPGVAGPGSQHPTPRHDPRSPGSPPRRPGDRSE